VNPGTTAVAIALTFAANTGCELDTAFVSFVPPNTARVLVAENCVGATCWSRYLVVDGQRLSESRMCETDAAGRRLRAPQP
jgi:hypothetical protein